MTSNVDSASQRTNSINSRTSNRNIPSQSLQPYFDSRPVPTKYYTMPIVDNRKQSTVPVNQMPTFNIEKTFNPGTGTAPWSGFASNINNESILRNQIYALQDCSQAVYIPKSKSDLYEVNWTQKQNISQPFPGLFLTQSFDTVNPNPNSELIGYALFNNATRQQNKDLKPN
jgi:hypothetical protein